MKRIDLNCDLGEGGAHDAELMPLITSANIACGAHAGDIPTMRASVELARQHGVRVGAHPGFADPEHFGRRELELAPAEIKNLVRQQVLALCVLGPVRHVKPHGGLYTLAARDRTIAAAVARTVHEINPGLVLFAQAGSQLAQVGRALGLTVAEEVFADRTYRADGSLTPRSQPNALLETQAEMLAQVLEMVGNGRVRTSDGGEVPIHADTICLHGDGVHAVEVARSLRVELTRAGIDVRAFN